MRPSVKGVAATFAMIALLGAAADSYGAAVTVRDPAFDLPHICADSDLDAARQQGFEAARDRVGQFLLVMSVARGTLFHAIGNLPDVDPDGDIETRRTGYARSEYAKMFQALPADAQAIILAYADGVNHAISEMTRAGGSLDKPVELEFFIESGGNSVNLFGNASALTQGEGADPHYLHPLFSYPVTGFQFTPELALAFAVLQIRNFGFEGWDELGMAEDLDKLITAHGALAGAQLWDDRHWMNDPLAPVSVPDPRNPGFGGPLAKAAPEQRIELAKAAGRLRDKVLGTGRLPGYPMRDYTAALQPLRDAHAYKERLARKWGAWPALGSYAWTISAARSDTGNPWVGGFPQTGIQVPSIMHYSEIRGSTMKGNGMVFVGGPYVLIGHTDTVAFTTTTAHLKVIDTYIEELAGGDFDLFKYDNHGTVEDMAKRIELVYPPSGASIQVPVFRTNNTCSANGCNGGTRPVLAFSGDWAGEVDTATTSTITDNDAGLTPGALVGGHVAIVDGTGAGQIRAISGNTANSITIGAAWTTPPTAGSDWVAVPSGENITAVAMETSIWLEEGEAVRGFSGYQQADDVLDIRDSLRFIPSTHNFLAADNQPHNGVGTAAGNGNIYYGTSGFHRVRQTGVIDARLPLDGTDAEPFAVVSGVVDSAGGSSLTDTGAFSLNTFTAAAVNYTYDNPDDNGQEYVVQITAGNGIAQTRRIVSNTADTLTLEHSWGKIPSAGDTYSVYEIWATPEAMNPAEGFTANWNNKQSRANDVMLSQNGRNHRVEALLEQLSLDSTIDREDLRALNEYVAGVFDPGLAGRYLLGRLQAAISAHGDCGTVDDELIAQNADPERGREFVNPLVVGPAGEPLATAAADRARDYINGWATGLAADIYGDEYDPASVGKLTGSRAIGWALHAIDSAEGDVTGSYSQVYAGDYFNGQDWKQVVRDSFCDYVTLNPTIGTKNRTMSSYNHPLAGLPCTQGCATPIEFDPTPEGNRGTWEQIVEVGATMTGEFMFPLGQSGHNIGFAGSFSGDFVRQTYHTSSLHPLWRDWRFVPMLQICQDVTLGGDEDGDTDGDGVVDAYERWYYGNLTNGATSDTDSDGATLATEWRWGSDPTLADTDSDGTEDGTDVAPQDRLCVKGTLKKLTLSDSDQPLKDKASAKWEVPLNVCIGGDFETACTTNADCGAVGRCRRMRMDPQRDLVRVVAGDDSPIVDADLPDVPGWDGKYGLKYSYKDADGVNSAVTKIKVDMNEKKGVVRLSFSAKNFDTPTPVDGAQGVVGISFGGRCFMETATNCKTNPGKLRCKAD